MRVCFDQPVASFAPADAPGFHLQGYNEAVVANGTTLQADADASCLLVDFAASGSDVSQYTILTVDPGIITNASTTLNNLEGATELTGVTLGGGGLPGRTTGPDLTSAAKDGSITNDVLYVHDEILDPTSCMQNRFGFWKSDGTTVVGTATNCSIPAGSNTARVSFLSTADAVRFFELSAAVTDRGGDMPGGVKDPNPLGSTTGTLTCAVPPAAPGTPANCTADLTSVNRVDDQNVDYTFDLGPTATGNTECAPANFLVFEEDSTQYSAAACDVRSSSPTSTVVRATFSGPFPIPTANFSAFETPSAGVQNGAITTPVTATYKGNTDGALPLGTSREASGFTDAPDLESADFDSGLFRVTYNFDENVNTHDPSKFCIFDNNAAPTTTCPGAFVSKSNNQVVMSFPEVEINNAVGALVRPGAVTDFPGNTSVQAAVGRGPAPSAGTVQFSSPTFSVNENGGSATISVTRTGGSSGAASVNYSTSDGSATNADYTPVNGTLNWANGDSSTKTFNVPITDDLLSEGTEAFNVNLSGATGAGLGTPSTASVSIIDNDSGGSFSFSAGTYAIGEAAGTATITVNRTGGSSGTASVQYQTSNGTATAGSDYVASSGTLTFGNGVTTQSFNVPITNDVLVEGNETVNLSLFSPSGASLTNPSSAVLTIVDDDTSTPGVLSLASASQTITESGGSQTVTVNRTGGTTGAVSVNYATSNGTAVAGQDYTATSGTLNFAAGETTKSFSVPILNDSANESAESFNVVLSSPGGGATLGSPSSAVVTITDDDLPAPGVIGSELSLRYSNRRNSFKGRVIIPVPGTTEIRNVCRDDREIVLRKLNGGGRRTAFTGPLGKFSILKPRPGNAGWYAIVKATGPRTLSDGSQVICGRGESSVVFT